jgi:hypothetical protein
MLPIKAAERLAEDHDLQQVIIFGFDGKDTFITTWGDTTEHSAQAAKGANLIKEKWGWPAELQAESAKVIALRERAQKLEETVSRLMDRLEKKDN